MDEKDWPARWASAWALGELKVASKEVVQTLIKGINDESDGVRRASAEALGKLRVASEEVVQKLIKGMDDEDWQVRWASAEALGMLGVVDKEVIEVLLKGVTDESWWVRGEAAEALEKLSQGKEEVLSRRLCHMVKKLPPEHADFAWNLLYKLAQRYVDSVEFPPSAQTVPEPFS